MDPTKIQTPKMYKPDPIPGFFGKLWYGYQQVFTLKYFKQRVRKKWEDFEENFGQMIVHLLQASFSALCTIVFTVYTILEPLRFILLPIWCAFFLKKGKWREHMALRATRRMTDEELDQYMNSIVHGGNNIYAGYNVRNDGGREDAVRIAAIHMLETQEFENEKIKTNSSN